LSGLLWIKETKKLFTSMANGAGNGGGGAGGNGGGGNNGAGNRAEELQPHPVKEQLPGIQYCVNSPPPWRMFFYL